METRDFVSGSGRALRVSSLVLVALVGTLGLGVTTGGCGSTSATTGTTTSTTGAGGTSGATTTTGAGAGGAAQGGGGGDPGPPAAVALQDVSAVSGLPRASEECMAVRDFDGDGKPDLLLSPRSMDEKTASLAVYLNQGNDTFTRVDIPTTIGQLWSCAVGDVDNDGRSDVVILDYASGELSLLHNEGTSPPTFKASLFDPIVAPPSPGYFMVTLADFDADGFLDLHVSSSSFDIDTTDCDLTDHDIQCHMIADGEVGAPLLLRNNQGKGFIASPMTLPSPQATIQWAVSSIDWDQDGKTDLLVSGDYSTNRLLRNEGDHFTDLLPMFGANVYNHGMGAAFADFDHDGLFDFYVADIGPDQVWMSKPGGGLVDRALALGITDPTRSHTGWGPVAGDFNNDGYDDVFVGNSIVAATMQEMADLTIQDVGKVQVAADDFLFLNAHGTSFVTQKIPFDDGGGRSHVRNMVADFDGDGRLDLVEGPVPLRLLKNVSQGATTPHWIGVRLKGKASPVNAHGAVVSIEVTGGTVGRKAAEAHDGFGTSSEVLHFGLGNKGQVAAIHVLWPGGKKQEVKGPLEVDRIIEISEP